MADTSTSSGAFLQGQDTTLDSQSSFLKGSINTTDSQSAYMEMGTISLSELPAFLEGRYTHGYVFVGEDQVVVGTGNKVYIQLITSSIPAYIYNDGSIQLRSSQSAYMTGAESVDSTPAYLIGQSTNVSSQPAFMVGAPVRGVQPAWLAGGINVDSSVPAHLVSGIAADTSQSAFMHGAVAVDSSQSAYISGHPKCFLNDCEDLTNKGSQGTLSLSSNAMQGDYSVECAATTLSDKLDENWGSPICDTTLYTDPVLHLWVYITDVSALSHYGQIEITSTTIYDNQELHWDIDANGLIANAAGPGLHYQLVDGWNELNLRLSSADATGGTFNGGIQFFRFYYVTSMNQIVRFDDIYITEFAEYTSTASAYLNSLDGILDGSKSAFLAGTADDEDDKSAYMFGGTTLHDSASAYMFADAIPANDSQAAFVAGGTTVHDSQSAYMEMGTIAEDTVSAYISGQSTTGAWQSCYLIGQHPRSYQDAFMTGQWAPTAADSISVYLDSKGAWPFSDDFTGDDEDDWSEFKWYTESIDD